MLPIQTIAETAIPVPTGQKWRTPALFSYPQPARVEMEQQVTTIAPEKLTTGAIIGLPQEMKRELSRRIFSKSYLHG